MIKISRVLAFITLGLVMGSGCSTSSHSTIETRHPASTESLTKIFKGDAWVVRSAAQLDAFDDLYFVSDIHGRFSQLLKLLSNAKLISKADSAAKWTGKRAMIVFVGDYIDGGPDGAKVLRLLQRLQKENPASVQVLMGNHEAELLADPDPSTLADETVTSFAKDLKISSKKLTAAAIKKSDLYAYMQSMPLGAILGSWLVAHSGYLDGGAKNVDSLIDRLGAAWSRHEFDALSDGKHEELGCLIASHDWWDANHKDYHDTLESLGINGMLAGHEPGLFGDNKTSILISNAGWAVKLDTNLKDGKGAKGEMLHCKVASVRGQDGSLNLTDASGKALCTRSMPSGGDQAL